VEMSGGTDLPRITDAPYFLTLGPYGYYWFLLRADAPSPITVRPLTTMPVPADESPLLLGPDWSQVLAGSTRELLERRYLQSFLKRQRWFAHGQAVMAARIVDWGTLRPGTEPL